LGIGKRVARFLYNIYFRKGMSMIGTRKLFLVGLALLTVGGLVSCQSTATPTLPVLSQQGLSVGISDDSCPNVIVYVGQQISWTNQGKQEHIVRAKSVEGERAFDSGTLKPGESFAVTLTQPDVYQYECSADGSLTGMITLEP
jgi:hypothetical protein